MSYSQDRNSLDILDSIQKNVLNSKVKDSSVIANAHFNIGEIYRKTTLLSDSAYFHYHEAEKIYKNLNDKLRTAMALYGISVIQNNEKDFTGSEVTAIEGITLLESLEQTEDVKKYKAFIYNNLGLTFGEMEQYDESISYYEKALEIKENLKGDNYVTIIISRNNLGLSYKKSGQYQEAVEIFKGLLEDGNLAKRLPGRYAIVLDNYANALYLSKKIDQIPYLYFKALKICDSLGDAPSRYNSIIINRHLAEYYNDKKLKDSAKYYAYMAKNIAKEFSNDEYLESILLLSKVEEGSISAKYLKDYIKLSDSLQKVERQTRNKFARIRFETKQIEQKNIKIAREKMWLTIVSIILLITALLVYIIISQRSKNKELKFVQQQQEANEEIYNLMLTQQEKIEEARTLEKKNISQELHDGVLGRLFGTRLSLDSLNMANSVEAIKTREKYIQDLKTIEEDIRKVSHELNTDFISGSGFLDIVKTLLQTQTRAYNLDYKFNYDDSINWEDLSNKNKIHIYRIIQESIHNIYKHANASLIKIGIQLKNNVILLTIEDNGSGFDVNKAKAGIGLKNMTSRVKEIGGELTITSEKDIGTTVKIKVPI